MLGLACRAAADDLHWVIASWALGCPRGFVAAAPTNGRANARLRDALRAAGPPPRAVRCAPRCSSERRGPPSPADCRPSPALLRLFFAFPAFLCLLRRRGSRGAVCR